MSEVEDFLSNPVDTVESELKRLDFMISKGYIDITDWGDEIAFKIMTEALELWKQKER